MQNSKLLIICNGPSCAQLFEWGVENIPSDVDTIGTSLAYRYFQEINWWPTYYCLGDPKVLQHHHEAFQTMISDPDISISKFFLGLKLPSMNIDLHFDDSLDRVVDSGWQVTGQMALEVGLKMGYKEIYFIGSENRYYWDHDLVKALPSFCSDDNRAVVLQDVVENPNYGIPRYLRKGDVTSWLFNHPDKSFSTTSTPHRWASMLELAECQGVKLIDFSNGELPVLDKRNSIIDFFES